MENIKIVKLKTTEDVICLFSEDETTITMSSPLTVYIEFNTIKPFSIYRFFNCYRLNNVLLVITQQ